ncbi:MAG: hypothetical protein IJ326_01575 [Lachnospiraceae bacterium]|nr:hypothetical protein [Lachnospiraceae bacterium]
MAISVVEKRILKSGRWSKFFGKKSGISDIKISQKSGILIQDFLQKGGMYQVNISDFLPLWKGRLALKTIEEQVFF